MAKNKLSKRNAVIASTAVIGGTSLTAGILSLPSIGTIGLTGLHLFRPLLLLSVRCLLRFLLPVVFGMLAAKKQ